jgi:hypothetical protein
LPVLKKKGTALAGPLQASIPAIMRVDNTRGLIVAPPVYC